MFKSFILASFFTFALIGCNSKTENKGEGKDSASQALQDQNQGSAVTLPDEKILIGLSLADLKEERWQRDRDYFVAKAESLSAKVIVQDAGGDPNAQVRQCDGLIAKGIKVLVVVPKNADAARPIVLNAHAKNVKVISYDRLIANAPVDLYLSFDNVKVGEIQAKTLIEKTPKGNYLMLRGDPADKNSDMIHEGHLHILKPLIDKGDIKIVVDQACDKWLRSEARRITADALQKFKIDAVLASNDGTASGAISALEDKQLAGKLPVSGQDADLLACQYIWKGIQTVTVYKPIRQLAEYAAEASVKAAKSGTFDSTSVILDNGADKVPTVFLEPIAVTKENLMSTVVADGFHTEAEITGAPSASNK